MKKEYALASESEKTGMCDVICLRDRAWARPLLICVVLHGGMQFAGINVVCVVFGMMMFFRAYMYINKNEYTIRSFVKLCLFRILSLVLKMTVCSSTF